jgi:hypothetical protein
MPPVHEIRTLPTRGDVLPFGATVTFTMLVSVPAVAPESVIQLASVDANHEQVPPVFVTPRSKVPPGAPGDCDDTDALYAQVVGAIGACDSFFPQPAATAHATNAAVVDSLINDLRGAEVQDERRTAQQLQLTMISSLWCRTEDDSTEPAYPS